VACAAVTKQQVTDLFAECKPRNRELNSLLIPCSESSQKPGLTRQRALQQGLTLQGLQLKPVLSPVKQARDCVQPHPVVHFHSLSPAGYSCALTTDAGSNSIDTDLFRLRRAVVRRYDTIDVFAARVSGPVGWLRIIRDFFLQTFSSFKPLRRSLQFFANPFFGFYV